MFMEQPVRTVKAQTPRTRHEPRQARGRTRIGRQKAVVLAIVTACSLLFTALFTAVAYWGNSWRQDQLAAELLQRADDCEKHSKWLEAADCIDQYLWLRPADDLQRVRLATIYARGASSFEHRQRAIDLGYRGVAVGDGQQRLLLREQLATLLLQNGRFIEAEAEAAKLLAESAMNAAALRIQALAIFHQHESGGSVCEIPGRKSVIASLAQAHQLNPGDIALTESLAAAYRDAELSWSEMPDVSQADLDALADGCMDDLVRASEDSRSYFSRYRYREKWEIAGANDDLEYALQLAPHDPDVLLAAAQSAQDDAERILKHNSRSDAATIRLLRASELYQRLINQKHLPSSAQSCLALGQVLIALDQREEAIATWKGGLSVFDDSAITFHGHLASAWLESGELTLAEQSLDSIDQLIQRSTPVLPRNERLKIERDQHLRRGIWRRRRSEHRLAIVHLKQAIVYQDQLGGFSEESTQAWTLLGESYASLRSWSESAAAFDRASLEQPEVADSRLSASISWLKAQRYELAVDRAEQVMSLQATSVAWFVLANALFHQQITFQAGDRSWSRFEHAIKEAMRLIHDGSWNGIRQVDLPTGELSEREALERHQQLKQLVSLSHPSGTD